MPTPETELKALNALVGSWTTEATHPALPGVVVRGSADVEWLEGEKFLIHRSRMDHPDFPDGIAIFGFMEQDRVGDESQGTAKQQLRMHYFDSRGVFRIYDVGIDGKTWRYWRNAPGFSQRFTGTFADGGKTIVGVSQLNRDDAHWEDDLKITYRRSA